MSGNRVRLIELVVQLNVVVDDGTTLRRVGVKPVSIPAEKWPEFAAGGIETALSQLQAQVDSSASTPPEK